MDLDVLPYAGKLAALLASFMWSFSITIYRAQGQGMPAQTLNLYKLFVALVGFSALVALLQFGPALGWIEQAPRFPASWQKSGWLMASGIIGLTLGDTLFFVSIRHLGAALTAALQCLTPPLNALIDWIYLGIPMTTIQVVGMVIVIVAVAGVVLAGSSNRVGKHLSRAWTFGLLAAVGSALCQAVAYAMQGQLLKNENIFACMILRIGPAFLILAGFAIFSKTGRHGAAMLFSHPRKMGYLTLAAFIGTLIGITLLSYAFQHADTGIVSTISTTYPIWVIPVAAFFLKEYPTPWQVLCTILAIVGIALLMLPASFWIGWLPA